MRQKLTTQGRKKLEPGKASTEMKKTQEYHSHNATLLSGTEVELSPHSELQFSRVGCRLAGTSLVRTRCRLLSYLQPSCSYATL